MNLLSYLDYMMNRFIEMDPFRASPYHSLVGISDPIGQFGQLVSNLVNSSEFLLFLSYFLFCHITKLLLGER